MPVPFEPAPNDAQASFSQAHIKNSPEGAFLYVLGGGLEPPTPSSSGKCSTN